MRYEVTISSRGTITLPAALRKALDIKPGQKVRQSLKGNKIVIEFGIEPKNLVRPRESHPNK